MISLVAICLNALVAVTLMLPLDQGQQLQQAIDLFYSASQDQALGKFSELIDTLDAADLPWSESDQATVASALSYRSQLFLNLANQPWAIRDLTRLLQIQPSFHFDSTQVSPKIVDLLTQTRSKLEATVLVKRSNSAVVLLDSHRIDRIGVSIPVTPGFHLIEIRAYGQILTRDDVVATAGSSVTVDTDQVATAPASTSTSAYPRAPAAPPPQRVTPATRTRGVPAPSRGSGDTLPSGDSHRVFVDGSSLGFVGGSPRTESFHQTIYGQTASFDLSSQPEFQFGGYEFGGSVRVNRGFGVGAHITQATRSAPGQLSGLMPRPQANTSSRTFADVRADFAETQRTIHLEARAELGNASGGVTFFAGPSFISSSGSKLGFVTVKELSGGSFIVTPVPAAFAEGRVGLNLGADVSYFPSRFVGIGVSIRDVVVWNESNGSTAKIPDHSALATCGLRFRF